MFSEALLFNRLSFARILRQVLWWSVTMVTRYDVISTRWSSHFWVQMHVFSTSFNNKSKNVAKMIQSAYLCVILHVKRKKLPFLAVLTWFLILDKIQDGGQDDDHVWWRHRPPAVPPPIKYTATSSCSVDQRLSTEVKIVSKYCNISKTLGRGPLPCNTVEIWICMCVQGLMKSLQQDFAVVMITDHAAWGGFNFWVWKWNPWV